VDPELPATGTELSNARHRSAKYAAMAMDGTADGTWENDEGPGGSAGASDQDFLVAPPTGFEPVSPP
jgi:hypothetical protein